MRDLAVFTPLFDKLDKKFYLKRGIMETVEISNVVDFLGKIQASNPRFDNVGSYYYRGQANANWSLQPSLFRIPLYKTGLSDYLTMESRLLNISISKGLPFVKLYSHNMESFIDWLTLMQHHGLPTRLLDWTTDALVGLFFAIENTDASCDAAVWCIKTKSNMNRRFFGLQQIIHLVEPDTYDNTDKCLDGSIMSTRHSTPRIQAQNGVFSFVQMHKPTVTRFQGKIDLAYQEGYETCITSMTKYIVKGQNKVKIKRELSMMGVDSFRVYPDLDGLTQKLKWDLENLYINPSE